MQVCEDKHDELSRQNLPHEEFIRGNRDPLYNYCSLYFAANVVLKLHGLKQL